MQNCIKLQIPTIKINSKVHNKGRLLIIYKYKIKKCLSIFKKFKSNRITLKLKKLIRTSLLSWIQE